MLLVYLVKSNIVRVIFLVLVKDEMLFLCFELDLGLEIVYFLLGYFKEEFFVFVDFYDGEFIVFLSDYVELYVDFYMCGYV